MVKLSKQAKHGFITKFIRHGLFIELKTMILALKNCLNELPHSWEHEILISCSSSAPHFTIVSSGWERTVATLRHESAEIIWSLTTAPLEHHCCEVRGVPVPTWALVTLTMVSLRSLTRSDNKKYLTILSYDEFWWINIPRIIYIGW